MGVRTEDSRGGRRAQARSPGPPAPGRPVLVTGFEPFLKHRVNSSWEAVCGMAGAVVNGRPVLVRQLPVSFARAGRRILGWLRELRPAAVVLFGLADEGRVRLERIALNVDDAEKPDNDGGKPVDRRIVAGGRMALESRLPLAAIERRLKRERIPVRRSFHAGTYLCNHVFYRVLAATRVPVGFVHVPPLAERGRRKGRMGLAALRRTARVVVEETVRALGRRPRASRPVAKRGSAPVR